MQSPGCWHAFPDVLERGYSVPTGLGKPCQRPRKAPLDAADECRPDSLAPSRSMAATPAEGCARIVRNVLAHVDAIRQVVRRALSAGEGG